MQAQTRTLVDGEGGAGHWYPAQFWSAEATGIRCELCPRHCLLSENEAGWCQVRRVLDGELKTVSYGATSMAHLDAVEKKPLYHFKPGLKTLTIALPGCNLACTYCQNHRLSQWGRSETYDWPLQRQSAKSLVERAKAQGAAIAMSYSEPTLSIEWALELGAEAKAQGVDLLWKSNGFMTAQVCDALADVLSAINIDVKGVVEADHRALTGVSFEAIWQSIVEFVNRGVWVELSLPLIEGRNLDDGALRTFFERLAALKASIPVHLLRVHPHYRNLECNPTHPQTLARVREIAHQSGLHYVYVERALGEEARNTKCVNCGRTCINRGIWSFEGTDLLGDRCTGCNHIVDMVL